MRPPRLRLLHWAIIATLWLMTALTQSAPVDSSDINSTSTVDDDFGDLLQLSPASSSSDDEGARVEMTSAEPVLRPAAAPLLARPRNRTKPNKLKPVRPPAYVKLDQAAEIEKLRELFKNHSDDLPLLAMREKIRAENISKEDASSFGRSILRGLVEKRFNIEPPLSSDDIICRCNSHKCDSEITQRIGQQFSGFCRVTLPGYCRQAGYHTQDGTLEVSYDCLSWNTHHTYTKDTMNIVCHPGKLYESSFCCASGHLCNFNQSVWLPERHPGQDAYDEQRQGIIEPPPTSFFTVLELILFFTLIASFVIIGILACIIRRRPGGIQRFCFNWFYEPRSKEHSKRNGRSEHEWALLKGGDGGLPLSAPTTILHAGGARDDKLSDDSGHPRSDGGRPSSDDEREFYDDESKRLVEKRRRERGERVRVRGRGGIPFTLRDRLKQLGPNDKIWELEAEAGYHEEEEEDGHEEEVYKVYEAKREDQIRSLARQFVMPDLTTSTGTGESAPGGGNIGISTSGSGRLEEGFQKMIPRTISRQVNLEKMIGEGRFGEVWVGEWRGEEVAVKIFNTQETASFERERLIFAMNLMSHPNILRFISCDSTDSGLSTQFWLVTEYYPLGSLFSYLQKHTLSIENTVRIVRGIANGLSVLHAEVPGMYAKPAIAHRDLKTRNILVRADLTVVLADFGLSAVAKKSGEVDYGQSVFAGTLRYMPPELLTGEFHPNSMGSYQNADVYTAGLVIWEVARRTDVPGAPPAVFDESIAYHDMVPRDPTREDMIECVATSQLRPPVSAQWREHPLMDVLVRMMLESWIDSGPGRITALNIRSNIDCVARRLGVNVTAT